MWFDTLWSALRATAFRGLEALSHLRRPPEPVRVSHGSAVGAAEALASKPLWVYVTTIGELNAIETWLRELLARLQAPPLVLLTNHAHYAEAYQRKFPQAAVVAFQGAISEAEHLVRAGAPRMLVIAEIPCLLHDAPCRFSYATLRAVRRAGAPVVLINGWLYGYQPASRMDGLEKRLFARDYVRSLDVALVQTEEVKAGMVAAGARPERIHVTGNLKYDAMRARALRRPDGPLAQVLLDYRAGPVVVAGSVTETADQRGILAAFADLLRSRPQARLMLAPRHPENTQRMAALAALLDEAALGHQYRSRIPADAALEMPVLILDTMGELGDCYAAAAFAYVGTDHNVLEPLAHARLVYVSGDWQPMYPSYPVYQQTVAMGLVIHVASLADLGRMWRAAADDLDAALEAQRLRVERLIASATGRVDDSLELLLRHVGQRVGA